MLNFLKKHIYTNRYVEVIYRIFIVLIYMQITRWIFYWCNSGLLSNLSWSQIFYISSAGLIFDLTAILYMNIPYILMNILPFDFVYNSVYRKISNWVFGITNFTAFSLNIVDIPFYHFTMMRTQPVHIS